MSPDLEALYRRLAVVLEDLSPEQTQANPTAPGSSSPPRPAEPWSIQQIVQHLLLSYKSTCTALELRLSKGTPTLATPGRRQRFAQLTVITLGHFPKGVKAPGFVDPGPTTQPRSGLQLAAESYQALHRMDRLLGQTQSLFGSRQAVSHQLLSPLRASQWRRFHLVHALHHIRQIQAIRRAHSMA